MAIVVEVPERHADLVALIRLHDTVHSTRRARWGAEQTIELPLLTGESPFAADRRIRPFVAREDGRLVARAVAVVDERYNRHWNENIGHVVLFEAQASAHDATRAVLDAACDWLARRGVTAARAGFGVFDFPFVSDAYDPLPPDSNRRGNLELPVEARPVGGLGLELIVALVADARYRRECGRNRLWLRLPGGGSDAQPATGAVPDHGR